MEKKRLFFGIEIFAPWPIDTPQGRLLDPVHRHLTLAFLGNIDFPPLNDLLTELPSPTFAVGCAGYFDACLALPLRHPSVIAWHAAFYEGGVFLKSYQEKLAAWLRGHSYNIEDREWLPHVTLCRKPFDQHAWMKTFAPLPFQTGSLHLYESMGNLVYQPIRTKPIVKAFEELEHTADIAFLVSGSSLRQLYHHAFTALAFKFPPLLSFFKPDRPINNLDDVIANLNECIAHADSEVGCAMKAVSYHGMIVEPSQNVMQWEMIVDV